jgi:hypothetical protein
MSAWEFVVVYLAAFVLLQLVVYRYLSGRGGEESRAAVSGPPNTDRGIGNDRDPEGHQHRKVQETVERAGTDPIRRCPHCGATNDPDGPYTFCHNCASRLPG